MTITTAATTATAKEVNKRSALIGQRGRNGDVRRAVAEMVVEAREVAELSERQTNT